MRTAVPVLLLLPFALPAAARELLPEQSKPQRRLQVIYLEGSPRWEYRWHRTILERGAEGKQFASRVFLAEADRRMTEIDQRMLAEFPLPADLAHADVVVLGDIDPKDPRVGEQNLKQLARFVTDGGGLVVIAGAHHTPHALKGTPLDPVLPIELGEKPARKAHEELTQGYRVRPTAAGLRHPAFRLGKDDDETHAIFDRLPVMYRFASGYTARPGTVVLAVHQTEGPPSAPHPLVLSHSYGKGRVVFVGFDESWRWRRDDGERHYAAFWVNLWRGAAAE